MNNATTFIAFATLLVWLPTITASAQGGAPECPPRPQNEKEAKELAGQWFRQGSTFVEKELFQEGLAAFTCSFEIVAHSATLYNMVIAAQKLGDDKLALSLARRLLNEYPDAPHSKAIEPAVVELVKRLSSEPESPAPPPVEEPPAPAAEQPPLPVDRQSEPKPQIDKRVLGYAALGLAGATAVTSVLMTVFSVQKKDDSENLHGGDAAKQGALEDQSNAFKGVAIVGYVLTAGLAVTGGVLVAKNPKTEGSNAKLSIGPSLGGFVLKGSF